MKTKNNIIRDTQDAIRMIFAEFNSCPNMTTEVLDGIERIKFTAVRRGEWVPCWAAAGHGVIVGGEGRLAGGLVEVVTGIARDHALALTR